MTRKVLLGGGGVLVACLLYLLLAPVPIDPIVWTPPVDDPGRFEPTGSLADATRFSLRDGAGPEDVAIDAEGRVYVGLEDGRVLRYDDPSREPTVVAHTGGRPLGLEVAKDGSLYVADARKGLVVVHPSGKLETLTSTCGGTKLVFTDELDIDAEGSVWFTDASVRFPIEHWKMELMESRPNGRLCKYDPSTKETTEVLKDLHFANGVAIDPLQRFVLINETSRYRVRKLWLKGPKAGQHEILIDNLPGFPDNLAVGEGGLFWIALPSQRNPLVDKLAGKPWLRKVAMRLPKALQPKADRTARVMAFDENGRIVHDLFDPQGTKIHMVTGVRQRGRDLYLGSLRDTAFARTQLPSNPTKATP